MRRIRCKGCRELFERLKPKEALCPECRELMTLMPSKDISLITKALAGYNERHNTSLTYGEFVNLIKSIEERRKANELEKRSDPRPQELSAAQAEP